MTAALANCSSSRRASHEGLPFQILATDPARGVDRTRLHRRLKDDDQVKAAKRTPIGVRARLATIAKRPLTVEKKKPVGIRPSLCSFDIFRSDEQQEGK